MSADNRARLLMTRHHHLVKHRQQSMLGRSSANMGLPVDASAHWSVIQGKPDSSFRMTYDRSNVALS